MIAGPSEEGCAHLLQPFSAQRLRVRRIETARQLGVKHVQRALVAPPGGGPPRVERVVPRAEKRLRAAIPYEAGKALVKGGLALYIHCLVGRLLNKGSLYPHRVPFYC